MIPVRYSNRHCLSRGSSLKDVTGANRLWTGLLLPAADGTGEIRRLRGWGMPAPSEFRFIWKMWSEEAAFLWAESPCATCSKNEDKANLGTELLIETLN